MLRGRVRPEGGVPKKGGKFRPFSWQGQMGSLRICFAFQPLLQTFQMLLIFLYPRYFIIDRIYLKCNRQFPSTVFSSWVISKMETRIKDLRVDGDLTQAQVAKAIGITQRKYSYLETGAQQWPDELLARLAAFYQTSVDYLLGLTDEERPYPRGKKRLGL